MRILVDVVSIFDFTLHCVVQLLTETDVPLPRPSVDQEPVPKIREQLKRALGVGHGALVGVHEKHCLHHMFLRAVLFFRGRWRRDVMVHEAVQDLDFVRGAAHKEPRRNTRVNALLVMLRRDWGRISRRWFSEYAVTMSPFVAMVRATSKFSAS